MHNFNSRDMNALKRPWKKGRIISFPVTLLAVLLSLLLFSCQKDEWIPEDPEEYYGVVEKSSKPPGQGITTPGQWGTPPGSGGTTPGGVTPPGLGIAPGLQKPPRDIIDIEFPPGDGEDPPGDGGGIDI